MHGEGFKHEVGLFVRPLDHTENILMILATLDVHRPELESSYSMTSYI